MKIYVKRGNTNYKEKKLIRQIEAALEKKLASNPELATSFRPATSFQQLRDMHLEYCADDAVIESTTKNSDIPTESKEESITPDTTSELNNQKDMAEENKNTDAQDPFNKEEPIIRDYVLKDEYQDKSQNNEAAKTSFGEPASFDEAFRIPDDINSGGQQGSSTNNSGGGVKSHKPSSGQNNESGDTSAKKKRRQERFAKYIVKAVCMLSEKGFVWYATKDINESKLAEYEINNEMDLSVLVEIEGGQEVSIKQFFKSQCFKAEELAKFTKEEQDDLSDALVEVFIEKNINPTASQNLALVGGEIFIKKSLDLFIMTSQTNSLLHQLRVRKSEETGHTDVSERPAPRQQEPVAPPAPQPSAPEPVSNVEPVSNADSEIAEIEEEELGIIESEKATKE